MPRFICLKENKNLGYYKKEIVEVVEFNIPNFKCIYIQNPGHSNNEYIPIDHILEYFVEYFAEDFITTIEYKDCPYPDCKKKYDGDLVNHIRYYHPNTYELYSVFKQLYEEEQNRKKELKIWVDNMLDKNNKL
jgi:hypothetical protein